MPAVIYDLVLSEFEKYRMLPCIPGFELCAVLQFDTCYKWMQY